jgi:hypothetical protein
MKFSFCYRRFPWTMSIVLLCISHIHIRE